MYRNLEKIKLSILYFRENLLGKSANIGSRIVRNFENLIVEISGNLD